MVGLDSTGNIWDIDDREYPIRLDASISGAPLDSEVVQIQCTPDVSTALLKSGAVLVWWSDDVIQSRGAPARSVDLYLEDEEGEGATMKAIRCVLLSDQVKFCRVPEIPMDDLPLRNKCADNGLPNRPQLVKIAAARLRFMGYDVLLGLTNQGHVLLFRDMWNETSIAGGHWEYVSDCGVCDVL